VFVSTILILAGPRTYERLSRPEPDGRAPVATVGVTLNDASAPAEPVDPTPVYTAGGFRAIQDTAITPLRWEPHLVELPIAFTPPGETLVADSLIQPE
jgi:hypothetical protein